jgi:Zn-finger nucleic acid-binding protein
MNCPTDGTQLAIADRQGIEIDYCPSCRGVWLDRGELDKLIDRSLASTAAPAPAAPAAPPPPQRGYQPPPQDAYQPPPPGAYDPYRRRDHDDDDYYDDDDDHRRHGGRRRRRGFLGDIFDFD